MKALLTKKNLFIAFTTLVSLLQNLGVLDTAVTPTPEPVPCTAQ